LEVEVKYPLSQLVTHEPFYKNCEAEHEVQADIPDALQVEQEELHG
jgi:hypothetical protein